MATMDGSGGASRPSESGLETQVPAKNWDFPPTILSATNEPLPLMLEKRQNSAVFLTWHAGCIVADILADGPLVAMET